jgi:hypothetical protein
MISNLTDLSASSSPARLEIEESEDALDLRRLEREAARLRRAFASDPSVRFVVGLDLLIRRAAIGLREAGRALQGAARGAGSVLSKPWR